VRHESAERGQTDGGEHRDGRHREQEVVRPELKTHCRSEQRRGGEQEHEDALLA
jgi:hypothetical protein